VPMTSREVVKAAVHFDTPDRMPLFFDALGVSDGWWVGWNAVGSGDRARRETVDEWGCRWVRSEVNNMGQVKGHPLAENDAWDTYDWPDGDNPAFFEGVAERLDNPNQRYGTCGIFMLLFERMHSLCGFEKVLTDLYIDRARMEELADRIVAFDLKIIRNMGRLAGDAVDALTFTDDWGTERKLFINPKLWCEFFQPRYKKIFDACHDLGWDVWMHTCGQVTEIIGPLIDIGLDVINLQQPRALGIEAVGERFAGKICFESLCDIQHTLPFKSHEEIRAEAKLLLDCWGTDAGGFILADYGDGEGIGVPDTTKRVMFDAFMEYDRWKNRETLSR